MFGLGSCSLGFLALGAGGSRDTLRHQTFACLHQSFWSRVTCVCVCVCVCECVCVCARVCVCVTHAALSQPDSSRMMYSTSEDSKKSSWQQ